jgi:hypothetical protein
VVGLPLKIFVKAIETWPISAFLTTKLVRDSHFSVLKSLSTTLTHTGPTFRPSAQPTPEDELLGLEAHATSMETLMDVSSNAGGARSLKESNADAFRRWTTRDYARAYRQGRTTPLAVAKRIIAAVRSSNKVSTRS